MSGKSQQSNNHLYIAFHLRNSVNASADAARIGVVLNDIFGKHQVETVDLDVQDKEIIYRVNKPILADNDGQREFFERLQRLFSVSEEYHPHFTQIYG